MRFFWRVIHDGQKYPSALRYAPLRALVVTWIEATMEQITPSGKPLLAVR